MPKSNNFKMNCSSLSIALVYILLLCLEVVFTRSAFNDPYDAEYAQEYDQYNDVVEPSDFEDQSSYPSSSLLDIFKSTRKRQITKRCYTSRLCCKTSRECCAGFTCGVNIWNWNCYVCIKKTWG